MADLKKLVEIDGCSEGELTEKIKKILKDFGEEVEDTINSLASESLGPFIVTLFALLNQMAVGAVAQFATFAATSLVYNTMGGLISMAGLSVSLINGVQIMLKYLAAKTLGERLQTRTRLAYNLLEDIQQLLDMLQAFDEVEINTEEVLLNDVDRALGHVKAAAALVGREYSKVQNVKWYQVSTDPLNSRSLGGAIVEINNALEDLMGNQALTPDYLSELNKLNKKYQIPLIPENSVTESASIPNPLGIVSYFQDSVDSIKEKYKEEGGSGLTQKGQQILRGYLLDFVATPGINEFFVTYATARFVGGHIKSVGTHLPVQSIVAKNLLKDRVLDGGRFSDKVLDPVQNFNKQVQSTLDNVFDFLNIRDNENEVRYASDTINMQGESRGVKISESAIILMDQWINIVRYESGILKTFLAPALRNLNDIKSGMEGALQNRGSFGGNSGKIELASIKAGWIAKLGLTQTLISSSIETPVTFGSGKRELPEQMNARFQDSLELFSELRTFILDRTVRETSPGNFEEVPREGDQIVDIANKKLQVLSLGGLAVLSPSSRKGVIAGLQSVKFLLIEQMSKDNTEINLCTSFTRSVEANPLFSTTIKPAWDAFIDTLGYAPLSGELTDYLSRGDLSLLVNALQSAMALAGEAKDFLNCRSSEEQTSALAQKIGTDTEEAKKFYRKSQESINRLKNKRKIIKQMISL